jgi:hypothetical protein
MPHVSKCNIFFMSNVGARLLGLCDLRLDETGCSFLPLTTSPHLPLGFEPSDSEPAQLSTFSFSLLYLCTVFACAFSLTACVQKHPCNVIDRSPYTIPHTSCFSSCYHQSQAAAYDGSR